MIQYVWIYINEFIQKYKLKNKIKNLLLTYILNISNIKLKNFVP